VADICVRVIPRSSREKIDVTPLGQIRVYVTAPPVDGEANAAVIALVAKRLGCAKGDVQVVRGESSRDKVLRVPDHLSSRLTEGAP
jgi:uncharacterized protein (TIGR00251 family)